MSDTQREVNVKFSGNSTEAQAAMRNLATSVRTSTAYVRESLGGMATIVERVKVPFVELAAVMAGGAAFREFVEKTEELGVQMAKAAQQTGLSVEQLGGLKFAAEQSDVSFESLSRGLNRLSLGLQTSAQTSSSTAKKALDELGIKATDASGRLRPVGDVVLEVADKFRTMEDGSGKTALAMQIVGRSGADLIPLLNQGSAGIKQFTDDAQSMGAVLSADGVEKAEAFHQAMGRVHLVGQAVSNTLGTALMPGLTFLGNALANSAKEGGVVHLVILGLKEVMEALSGVVVLTTAAFEQLGAVATFVLNEVMHFGQGAGKAIWDALHGRFSDAKADMAGASAAMSDDFNTFTENVAKSAEDATEAIDKIYATATDAPEKQKSKAPKVGGDGSLILKQMQDEWETIKEKQGAFADDLNQQELAFWQAHIGQLDHGSAEYMEVHKRIVDLKFAIQRQGLSDTMQQYSQEEAAAQGNAAEILRIRQAELAAIAAVVPATNKLYTEQLKRVNEAERAAQREARAIESTRLNDQRDATLAAITLEETRIAGLRDLGEISNAEALRQDRQLITASYDAKLAALQAELALYGDDAKERERINREITQVSGQRDNALLQNANQTTVAIKQRWMSVFDTITNAINQSFTGFMRGTQSFAQSFANLGRSIELSMLGSIVKMGEEWVAMELAKTQATAAGTAARSGLEEWAAAKSIAMGAWAALKNIGNYAATAIAATWSAISAIPYVGPFLAPGMAVAAGAAILALGSHVASARGGYDIPGGINPLTQLHEREMVLPAEHADTIRNLGKGGSAPGGGTPIIIYAMDGADVKRTLMRHPAAVAAGFHEAVRHGHITATGS